MPTTVRIEGIDELGSFLRDHTKELNKSVLQSMTKGSAVIKKEIVAQMPANLKKFKPIIATKQLAKSSNPTVLVGIFGRKMYFVNARGVKWDAFMLVYWANFGTMANRDSSHAFQYSRRAKSKNKKGGIQPVNFFDKAVDSSLDRALNVAEEDIGKTLDLVAAKYGFV